MIYTEITSQIIKQYLFYGLEEKKVGSEAKESASEANNNQLNKKPIETLYWLKIYF